MTTPPLPPFEKTLAFYEREGFAIAGGRKLKMDMQDPGDRLLGGCAILTSPNILLNPNRARTPPWTPKPFPA